MKKIVFSKYEGLGNDFIILDESQEKNRRSPSTTIAYRQALCDRRAGIGADGVITVLAPVNATSQAFMHVTNSDGSIPENCGNGLRCLAKWLLDCGAVAEKQKFMIDTYSGPKSAVVDGQNVTVGLGQAKVSLILENLEINNLIDSYVKATGVLAPSPIAFVDLGNPHLVLEAVDNERAQLELGPMLEKATVSKSGSNVSFIKPDFAQHISLRVWERGAGATQACGSGAGATVAALVKSGKIGSGIWVIVKFSQGILQVSAEELGDGQFDIQICGPANKVFEGSAPISE